MMHNAIEGNLEQWLDDHSLLRRIEETTLEAYPTEYLDEKWTRVYLLGLAHFDESPEVPVWSEMPVYGGRTFGPTPEVALWLLIDEASEVDGLENFEVYEREYERISRDGLSEEVAHGMYAAYRETYQKLVAFFGIEQFRELSDLIRS